MVSSFLGKIPADTYTTVHQVFHPKDFYLQVGDLVETIFDSVPLETISKRASLTASVSALLCLVTILQKREEFTDRQVSEAIRLRMEWKYALHLSLRDPGVRPDHLCAFRRQLHENESSKAAFQVLLDRYQIVMCNSELPMPLLAEEVITAICWMNRVSSVAEAFQQALNVLALREPDWMRAVITPSWYFRYLSSSLKARPTSSLEELEKAALKYGADIAYLLQCIQRSDVEGISILAEVEHLRRVYQSNYETTTQTEGILNQWRRDKCIYAVSNGAGCTAPNGRGNAQTQSWTKVQKDQTTRT
ncbi:MAG: transposase [Desulforhabdus sp.]|jgi:transposase|nr:transposase [Desulforhabdus sp.]